MFYDLLRTRIEGKLIRRWEMGGGQYVRGVLSVQERHIKELGRHSIVASFSASGVHDLYDATLRHTDSEGQIVLTGFEHRDDLCGRPVDFAQSWILRLSRDQTPSQEIEAIMVRAKQTVSAS